MLGRWPVLPVISSRNAFYRFLRTLNNAWQHPASVHGMGYVTRKSLLAVPLGNSALFPSRDSLSCRPCCCVRAYGQILHNANNAYNFGYHIKTVSWKASFAECACASVPSKNVCEIRCLRNIRKQEKECEYRDQFKLKFPYSFRIVKLFMRFVGSM
jgi:hypothetical protein